MLRAIDHLVLAAHDLAAQAEIYRRMGFTVGARNRHNWGTENHIIQFKDNFLELIARGEGFGSPSEGGSFAAFLGTYFQKREGLAMLCLRADDAKADAASFAAAGIGDGVPFHFGRKARRPDGSEIEVAFTLAFAQSPAIKDAGFFTCQQHFPQNFWNPAFQTHANGALGVTGLLMQAVEPAAMIAFLAQFTEAAEIHEEAEGVCFELVGHRRLEIVTQGLARERFGDALPLELPQSPSFIGFRIGVENAERLRAALNKGKMDYETRGEAVFVPAAGVCGAMLVFEPIKDEKA
jgi:hypothetical protein